MSDHTWEWFERGDGLEVEVHTGGDGLRIVAVREHRHVTLDLPPRAVAELAEWLDAQRDESLGAKLAEVEVEVRQLADERDAALRKVEERDRLLDVAVARLERLSGERLEVPR